MDPLQKFETGLHLKDAVETECVGEEIGRTISPGTVIGLHGNLGAGKTTLAKGLAKGWGVLETVKSPTFNYYLPYCGDRGTFVHLDAYRINDATEYDTLLLEDFLEEPWLLVVEWAERLPDRLPPETVHLFLAEGPGSGRQIQRRHPANVTFPPPV